MARHERVHLRQRPRVPHLLHQQLRSQEWRGEVFHTYSSHGRGIDMIDAAYQFFDFVPKGRDEDGFSFSIEWLRRYDQCCCIYKMEVGVRKLIAGMKISVDAKLEGPEGVADWVEGWSEDYGLMSQIDACVLGGGMYPGYEMYWTAIQNEPAKPLPMTGELPTPDEVKWGRFAARTPHYVLSRTQTSARWPRTSFLRGIEEIAALKQQPGKDIYLVGGARITASLIEAALVDELRLIVYPLIAGEGKALFATTQRRHALELRKVQQLQGERVSLIYGLA